jgi:hypothetical protein
MNILIKKSIFALSIMIMFIFITSCNSDIPKGFDDSFYNKEKLIISIITTYDISSVPDVEDIYYYNSNLYLLSHITSTIYKYNTSGQLVSSIPVSLNFFSSYIVRSAALTIYNNNIWITALNDSAKFYLLNISDGSIVGDVPRYSFNCLAMCYDNNYFWMIQNGGSYIHKLDTIGNNISTFYYSDSDQLFLGITVKDNYLYAAYATEIRKIDPVNGSIINKGMIGNGTAEYTVCGLTYDGTYFWVVTNSQYLRKVSILE